MSLPNMPPRPARAWLVWRPFDVIVFLALAAAGILSAWPVLRGMSLGWWAAPVILATALSFSFVMAAALRAVRWLVSLAQSRDRRKSPGS